MGKKDPLGENLLRTRDKGKALAGNNTLNRLELMPVRASGKSRYKKVVGHFDAMQSFVVDAFLQQYGMPPGLMRALRQVGLNQADMAGAQCNTLRVKLLKVRAEIRVSVRRAKTD